MHKPLYDPVHLQHRRTLIGNHLKQLHAVAPKGRADRHRRGAHAPHTLVPGIIADAADADDVDASQRRMFVEAHAQRADVAEGERVQRAAGHAADTGARGGCKCGHVVAARGLFEDEAAAKRIAGGDEADRTGHAGCGRCEQRVDERGELAVPGEWRDLDADLNVCVCGVGDGIGGALQGEEVGLEGEGGVGGRRPVRNVRAGEVDLHEQTDGGGGGGVRDEVVALDHVVGSACDGDDEGFLGVAPSTA